jgi:hypothetical protein
MAADDAGDSESAGCQQYGCGCAGIGVAAIVIAIAVSVGDSASFSMMTVLFFPFFLLVAGGILGVAAGNLSLLSGTPDWLGAVGKYTVGFGVLCLVSAIALTMRPGGFSYYEEVPANGGTVGPIEIEKSDMRLGVEVEQHIDEGGGNRYQRWSFVTIELLDENKEYLSSFGGEFWHYAGYDDGYWEEEDDEYEATLQVPSPGTYYLQLQTEANVGPSELSPVEIALEEQLWWGNPVPLQIAGYVALFLGVVLVVLPWQVSAASMGGTALAYKLKEGTEFTYRDRTWTVRGHADYDYGDWLAEEWTVQSDDVAVKTPRYLEREYEAHSDWEEWFWSTPIDAGELRCTDDEDTELAVSEYVSTAGDFPDRIKYEDTYFRLDDSGTTQRDGRSIRYRTYKEMWESGSRSITIEGDPSDELSAVVTESIQPNHIVVADGAGSSDSDWEIEVEAEDGFDDEF